MSQVERKELAQLRLAHGTRESSAPNVNRGSDETVSSGLRVAGSTESLDKVIAAHQGFREAARHLFAWVQAGCLSPFGVGKVKIQEDSCGPAESRPGRRSQITLVIENLVP